MNSYLGSLVQFSPAAGRAGTADRHRCVWGALAVLRPHWVCPVQGCLCFPRLHCSGSRLLYMERALRCVRFQFSGPPQKCRFGCACVLCLPRPEQLGQPEACAPSSRVLCSFSLRGERPRQPEVWALSPPVRRAFSLRGPSARRRSGLRKSSDRNRGLFARWEGVASLGLSLPLAPSRCLLPPVGMGRLFSGDSVPLFIWLLFAISSVSNFRPDTGGRR